MTLLYIHRTQGKGAEGVHIAEVCRAFEALGLPVITVSPSGESGTRTGNSPPSRGVRGAFFQAISRFAPALVFELFELAYNLPAMWRIRRLVRSGGVDILYERYAIFAFAGAHLASRARLPLVLEVNYTCGSPLVRRRSGLLAPLARRIERFVVSRANVLAVISEPIGAQVQRDHGVAPDRVVLTPNAANPEHFHPQVEPLRTISGTRIDGGPVIGFVGTFAPWHGLDLLVQAFARVAKRFERAMLVLVGDGPERKRVEQLVASSGLEAKTIFAGTVGYAELPRYVGAFTVGVMPDSNDYGSPVKVFEYMGCGKPVVAPDYAPLREVIQHGQEGLIFRRRDVDALARCLEDLLADPDLARSLGDRGRQLVVTRRNWAANARAVLAKLGRA
jgi:glycosyltransferase involved in cell wall biosynthesis